MALSYSLEEAVAWLYKGGIRREGLCLRQQVEQEQDSRTG